MTVHHKCERIEPTTFLDELSQVGHLVKVTDADRLNPLIHCLLSSLQSDCTGVSNPQVQLPLEYNIWRQTIAQITLQIVYRSIATYVMQLRKPDYWFSANNR